MFVMIRFGILLAALSFVARRRKPSPILPSPSGWSSSMGPVPVQTSPSASTPIICRRRPASRSSWKTNSAPAALSPSRTCTGRPADGYTILVGDVSANAFIPALSAREGFLRHVAGPDPGDAAFGS